MSATIPSNMLMSDLLKATGYDCPVALQGQTFAEATNPAVAVKPTITKNDAGKIEIATTTTGATVLYTTDGSAPSYGSSVYSSALTVDTGATVKAIAVKSGLANSEVASYTVEA